MNDENTERSVTLIYHNFRGMAQIIRYSLYFLNVPFKQILLKHGQSLESLKPLIHQEIKDQSQLPCLVDGDLIIYDTLAIIRHICMKAKRQDFLGQNLEQRTLIREIFYNFILKKKKSIKLLFKFGEEAATCPQKKEQVRKQAMLYSHKQSGSLIQMIALKMKRPTSRYIFNHITVLDLLFYEEAFYQVNLFGNLEESNCKIFQTINSIFGTDLSCVKDKSTVYLRIMRLFKENFEKQPFYVDHKEKLQSYCVLSPSMGKFSKEAFKRVWLGPESFLK